MIVGGLAIHLLRNWICSLDPDMSHKVLHAFLQLVLMFSLLTFDVARGSYTLLDFRVLYVGMNHVSATTLSCSCSAIFLTLIKADYWITW
jgi:hypothetical protein